MDLKVLLMRYIYLSFLLCFLFPVIVEAQKGQHPLKTGDPIIVNTKNGPKTIGTMPALSWERKGIMTPVHAKKELPAKEVFEGKRQERKIKSNARKMGAMAPAATSYWTGENNSDWFDAGNWSTGTVPSPSDFVIIQNGDELENLPKITGTDVSVSGFYIYSAKITIENALLTIEGNMNFHNSEFTMIGGSSTGIEIYYAHEPRIASSLFNGSNSAINIYDYTGSLEIYDNVMDIWYLYIEQEMDPLYDEEEEDEIQSSIFGNTIYGHLSIYIKNEFDEFYLANGAEVIDEIHGDLGVSINSNLRSQFVIGLGGLEPDDEPLIVYGNVIIDRYENHSVDFDKIAFAGDEFQMFTAYIPDPVIGWGDLIIFGTPLEIRKMFFRKDGRGLSLQEPIHISNLLHMGADQAIIFTSTENLLTLTNNAVVVDEDPVNGSFVDGPMEKIGNQAFTFPLGNDVGVPFRQGNPDVMDNSNARAMTLYGSFKAPLSISAPQNNKSGFIARYVHDNVGWHGYDPYETASGVSNIIEDAFWMLNRSGTVYSDVSVTLTYNKEHYEDYEDKIDALDFKIAGWVGDEWVAIESEEPVGDDNTGVISTSAPLTTYGPLGFYQGDGASVRVPEITITELASPYVCINRYYTLHFELDTAAVAGTILRLEISDENGNFGSSPTVLATKTTSESGSIQFYLYSGYTIGGNYKLRITGSPQKISSLNEIDIVVNTVPQEKVTIVGDNEYCLNTGAVKYYFTGKEDGVAYTWTVTGGTFTTEADTAWVTFTSGGNQTITVTPSNECGDGTITNFNVTVKPGAPTASPVLTNVGRWINASQPAAAQKVNTYKWFRNGTLIEEATNLSYYAKEGGDYTMQYANDCGDGPISNTITFDANALAQTITFAEISDMIYDDDPIELPAEGSAGLPVDFQILSGPGNITAGVYTITGTGTVTIKASQKGNEIYDTAAPVIRTFEVHKAPQVLSIDPPEDMIYSGRNLYLTLPAKAPSGLNYTYTTSSPNVTLSGGNRLTIKGASNVILTVHQPGNNNFLPSDTITVSFCVVVEGLGGITGAQFVCPEKTEVFRTTKFDGLTYQWSLSDGTVFGSDADTVNIQIANDGEYTLYVSATGPCGPPTKTDSISLTVLGGEIIPQAVANMIPENGIEDQKLPLMLSWFPSVNTLSYDLYLWKSTESKPAQPTAGDLTTTIYNLTKKSGLEYGVEYSWQLVSKYGCRNTEGPIQTFEFRQATDLVVTQVMAPASANAGQTITISWKVKNNGPGKTLLNESWNDAIMFSFDSIPLFASPSNALNRWRHLDFPVRPLLVGTQPNVAALDVGEEYENSINFDLPINFTQPLYVYVITNYKSDKTAPLQTDFSNDTARAPEPIIVNIPPTPDLRVDMVSGPTTTVFSGNDIDITYKVANYGAVTPAGSAWVDEFYISKSTLFNKASAMRLKAPATGGSFFNTRDQTVSISRSLETDSSYTMTTRVTIPNFISGTWFLHVVTNGTESVYEGALIDNNENNTPVQIVLSPTPQFTITSLNVSETNVSPTQDISLTWKVRNDGAHDMLERNQGFVGYQVGTCEVIPNYGGNLKNVIVMPVTRPVEKDVLSWGGSHWIDKVYISPNPWGLTTNEATLIGEVNQGIPRPSALRPDLPAIITDGEEHCVGIYEKPHYETLTSTRINVVSPGSTHSNSYTYTIPANLPEGEYYIYVHTNSTKTVFTSVDTPVVRRSNKIIITYPDFVVSNLNAPATITGGTPFSVVYTIRNNSPGSIYNTKRKDALYMSDKAGFDSTAVLLKTISITEGLMEDSSVTHTIDHTLPNYMSGTKYFFIRTNDDEYITEKSFANNISSAAIVSVSTAPPVDLAVSNVTIADTTLVPGGITLSYTLSNLGPNTANGEITDTVFVSCSPVFDRSTAVSLLGIPRNINITAGGDTTLSVSFHNSLQTYLLADCFVKADFSDVYFFVETNSTRSVYEGEDTTNNIVGSGKKVFRNANADLIVPSVTGNATAEVARPYTVTYEVVNIGIGQTAGTASKITSALYFSKDSVWSENAIKVRSKAPLGYVLAGDTSAKSQAFTVPNLEAGQYYIFIHADADLKVTNEINLSNNFGFIRDETGRAKLIQVEETLLPDLIPEIVEAPQSIPVGQPVEVKFKVTNSGAGDSYVSSWRDRVILSTGFNNNSNEVKYNETLLHRGTLDIGDSYEVTTTITLPLDFMPGNYFLLVNTDGHNQVIESNEENNLIGLPVEVYVPAPSDLVIQNITIPDTVYLGNGINSVEWTIQNQSDNSAEGISTDAVYLSKNTSFDTTAILIGLINKTIDMAPMAEEILSLEPVVDAVREGEYYVIVRTDIKNNINESDKENNESVSVKPIYVGVKELTLEVAMTDTMTNLKYLKLQVPDSLLGSTILLTFHTENPGIHSNEVYVGGGYVPSVLESDYKFTTVGFGNHDILLADVFESVYYIAARSVSPSPQQQNITVTATVLPFDILKAESNRGGNAGNVTVKLTGSLFSAGMTAKLKNNSTEIPASSVYLVNSTTAYITLPLMGKPIGVYDIVLTKPDESEATLPAGFSVVSPNNGGLYSGGGVNTGMTGQGTDPGCDPGALAGLNSQLVTELVIPDMLGDGWPFTFQINFNNPTNMDIPTQTKILFNDLDLPMSLTKEDVANGTSSLFIEIKETDGPPGVIRAGGSGTITIYSIVPRGTITKKPGLRSSRRVGNYVYFNLQ